MQAGKRRFESDNCRSSFVKTSVTEWQKWLDTVTNFFKTGQLCNISKRGGYRYYATVEIMGQTFVALLDSGATYTVISERFSKKLMALGISVLEDNNNFSLADGSPCASLGAMHLPVKFLDGFRVLLVHIVKALQHDMLLGMDFFEAFNLSIEVNLSGRDGILNAISRESVEVVPHSPIVSCDDLSIEERVQLDTVIGEMCTEIGVGLGRTHLLEHRIDTGDHLPTSQRQYPFAPPIMKELEDEIQDMLRNDVIELSHSAWRSPVLLVKKASGKNRLCLDSRQLNKITKRDSYPLPRVSTIIDGLKNARFLSTIDLRSAFWQTPLEESSKEKTAFGLAGKGLYQFKVMPFGLCNASQTQQRLMDRLFSPKFEGGIFAYLDDIVICNNSFKSHLESLKWVKDQLKMAGLTINVEKCQFARPSLKYLGYIVDKEGLRTDPDKVSAILNYPRPTTYTELKSFIGLASWYRRFVKNFAMVAAPLHELTKGGKKSKAISWNNEAENAFMALKSALTSTPVLSVPDFTRPFVVQCDASNKGIGAVLFQCEDDVERPVAYASRKLLDRETKYSASEKELLSVVHAVEQFRPYIEGSHFKVITDHSALQWLDNNKDPHGRLARWAMRLQQFDYEIVFRKGKDNVVADALSRATTNEINLLEINIDDKDDWYKSQEDRVLAGSAEADWEISQGKLWKFLKLKQFPNENDDWKLVVPEKLRPIVIRECHDSPLAGHMGIKKTVNRVRQRYFWPSLIHDVKSYVRKCEVCAKYKSSQLPPSGPMGKHREVSEPFQIVSMDLMGPFPRSRQGNTMLLVVSCWFSKFCLLFPLRTGKAASIAKILEEQIILMFGAPKVIICDNGKQFVSAQFKEVATNYDVDLWYTPYYHPQANPTERVNKVIGTAIASYVEHNHKDWDKYVPHIGHAIRTSVHEVTGKTPSHLFLGRETATHGFKINTLSQDERLDFNRQRYEVTLEHRKKIFEDVKERLERAYEDNKRRYDVRRRVAVFNAGDVVWKRTKILSNANKNLMAKLAPKFEQAVISEKVSADVYKLKSLRGKDLGKWHSSDLKPVI